MKTDNEVFLEIVQKRRRDKLAVIFDYCLAVTLCNYRKMWQSLNLIWQKRDKSDWKNVERKEKRKERKKLPDCRKRWKRNKVFVTKK